MRAKRRREHERTPLLICRTVWDLCLLMADGRLSQFLCAMHHAEFGGPLEQITCLISSAIVTFIKPEDAQAYYDATPNGIIFRHTPDCLYTAEIKLHEEYQSAVSFSNTSTTEQPVA